MLQVINVTIQYVLKDMAKWVYSWCSVYAILSSKDHKTVI